MMMMRRIRRRRRRKKNRMRSSLGVQIMMMLMRMIRLVTISHHVSDPNKAMASNCNTKPHQHLQL